MSRGKELAKNTIIIFIGRFCTQFLSFMLLPLYTRLLNAEEYGTVDLIITYVSLIVPCVTLELSSALYRFLLDCRDDDDEKTEIVSFVLAVVTLITVVCSALFLLIANHLGFKYTIYCVLIIAASTYSEVALQLIRGFGNYVAYSITSAIIGGLTVVLNVAFLVGMHTGATGMLISISLANIAGIVFAFAKCKIWKYIDFSHIHKKTAVSLLKYSIPLIPNSVIWWVINVSDRTLVTVFLGVAANGIYAISTKFPSVIMTIYSVFNLSWQETVSLHIHDSDGEAFINNTFNKLIEFFASLTIGLISVMWFAFPIMINSQYIDALKYVPILAVGSFFNVFVGMIGALHIGLKRTNAIATTSIAAGIINFLINICLIRRLGLYAASVSTLVAFLIMAIYRGVSIKNYFNLQLNIKKMAIVVGMFIFEITIFYIGNQILNILGTLFAVLYALSVNWNMLKTIIRN